jgi:Thoeris protein ThsB, TIR-like domain
MPALNTRHLFISHSWTYGDAYERLIELLDAAPNFLYSDYSIPRDDPVHDAPTVSALYEAIKAQVSSCHVVLILAGKYATYSDWIQREIKIAKTEFDKPVVAIRPRGARQMPKLVREAADQTAGWNTDSIVDAIRAVT